MSSGGRSRNSLAAHNSRARVSKRPGPRRPSGFAASSPTRSAAARKKRRCRFRNRRAGCPPWVQVEDQGDERGAQHEGQRAVDEQGYVENADVGQPRQREPGQDHARAHHSLSGQIKKVGCGETYREHERAEQAEARHQRHDEQVQYPRHYHAQAEGRHHLHGIDAPGQKADQPHHEAHFHKSGTGGTGRIQINPNQHRQPVQNGGVGHLSHLGQGEPFGRVSSLGAGGAALGGGSAALQQKSATTPPGPRPSATGGKNCRAGRTRR